MRRKERYSKERDTIMMIKEESAFHNHRWGKNLRGKTRKNSNGV